MENTSSNQHTNPESKSSSNQEEQVVPVSQKMKPGEYLAKKRKEANLSIEDVAQRLHITPKQVENIEADNYGALHGLAIARAFARAYAKNINIDPESVIALFTDSSTPKSTVQRVKPSQTATHSLGETFKGNEVSFRNKRRFSGKWLLAVIVVVIIAIVIWNLKYLRSFKKAEVEESAKVQQPAAVAEQPKEPTAEEKAKAEEEAKAKAEEEAKAKAKAEEEAKAKADKAKEEAQKEKDKKNPPITGKGSIIAMKFKAKSWVQIRRSDKSIVAEFTGQPNETRQVEVTGIVNVIVGNAPAVSVHYKGAAVDLNNHMVANTNVAQVTLK